MNKVDLISALKERSIDVDETALTDRLRAVAAAPESLVDGPDVSLVLPGVEGDALNDVAPLVRDAVRDQTSGYERDVQVEQGAARVALLREELTRQGLDGFVIPMADEYQNEYVPQHAKRLAWLSGFGGSAGTVVVTADAAAIFVDGRYTLQVGDQVDTDVFETLGHDGVADWIEAHVGEGQTIGFDPWLHTSAGRKALEAACAKAGATLRVVTENPVDAVWVDQPPKPLSKILPHPIEFAGEESASKRARLAGLMAEKDADALLVTAPDSIAWLFNIRGADVARTPLPLSYALLYEDGAAELFVDDRKVDDALASHLGDDVIVHDPEGLAAVLDRLGNDQAKVWVDPMACPVALVGKLEDAQARGKIRYGLHAQKEAMMTCFVPSAMSDDHVHFVDGASGGYAQAAAVMRA